MALTVRRVRVDEWEALRTVRLAALRDAPSAFGSTYEREVGYAQSEWAERAQLGAGGVDRVTFFAVRDGAIVGLVGGFRREADHRLVDLVSMWTAPEARRCGAGRALVGAVIQWAGDVQAAVVELWVTVGNEPAQYLYEAAGFVATGDVIPLPSDPCRHELRMRLVF